MKLVVLKFGGTSVADIPQIKKIALKVKKEIEIGNKVIVVVSAMSGVTNDLVDLVKKHQKFFLIQNMMLFYQLVNRLPLRFCQ